MHNATVISHFFTIYISQILKYITFFCDISHFLWYITYFCGILHIFEIYHKKVWYITKKCDISQKICFIMQFFSRYFTLFRGNIAKFCDISHFFAHRYNIFLTSFQPKIYPKCNLINQSNVLQRNYKGYYQYIPKNSISITPSLFHCTSHVIQCRSIWAFKR